MSYLDQSQFTLKSRIRRWLGDAPMPEAGPPPSWHERVFHEIGTFLSEHGLYPSPDNYDLAWQFRTAHNAKLTAAVHAEIAAHGVLSSDAAERIFAENVGTITPDGLARMAGDIEAHAEGLSGIARQSGADAAEFRSALEAGHDDVAQVVEVTRAMIARSRNAEAQLRRATKELQGLRAHLAEAQHFADVDPLTELANRRCFKRKLEAAIAETRATAAPLALAFIDIDHFKRLNDRHGHETGDRVLRFIAQLLTRHLSRHGMVGRFGGEEFVAVLPGCHVEQAHALVDAARAALADLPLYSAASGDRLGAVSFTAGVTALVPDDDMASLLRRADETLYAGKGTGRNRVLIG